MRDEIYGTAEVAGLLGISEESAATLMKEGQIQSRCTKRKWRTVHSAVVEYLKEETGQYAQKDAR